MALPHSQINFAFVSLYLGQFAALFVLRQLREMFKSLSLWQVRVRGHLGWGLDKGCLKLLYAATRCATSSRSAVVSFSAEQWLAETRPMLQEQAASSFLLFYYFPIVFLAALFILGTSSVLVQRYTTGQWVFVEGRFPSSVCRGCVAGRCRGSKSFLGRSFFQQGGFMLCSVWYVLASLQHWDYKFC